MYAIKPWGKAAVVGLTVGSATLGVGMRWRETLVEIADKHGDPGFELSMHRRCILSDHCMRLLADVGVTTGNILREVRPAKRWKFVTPQLATLRDGTTYPGCSPTEPVFTAPEGVLLRALRREFQRFGGQVSWDTEAFEAVPANDSTGTWMLKKDWGTSAELECVVSAAAAFRQIRDLVGARDGTVLTARYDVTRGLVDMKTVPEVRPIFGDDFDYVIVLGKQAVLHAWVSDPAAGTVSWNIVVSADAAGGDDAVGKVRSDSANIGLFHPVLLNMMQKSRDVLHTTVHLPTEVGDLNPEAANYRATLIENALLPVDPFEWRGDAAMAAIEDSAALVQRLYQKRYLRGFVPTDLRNFERDTMAKRAALLRRDLNDANTFLSAYAQLGAAEAAKAEIPDGAAAADASKSAAA